MTIARHWIALGCLAGAATLVACASSPPAQNPMTFFVTSANPGKGADLGGLAGADKYCKALASALGAGEKDWRAYLSTDASSGTSPVNARDRIGKGPWKNARGVVVANSVDELHGANGLTKQTALTEKGEVINGRGDTPNQHDMLTGSTPEGRVATGDKNLTWQLDTERRRFGRRRPPRPHRPRRATPRQVVELVTPLARLQPGCAEGDRRCRALLLLRSQLIPNAATARRRRAAREAQEPFASRLHACCSASHPAAPSVSIVRMLVS